MIILVIALMPKIIFIAYVSFTFTLSSHGDSDDDDERPPGCKFINWRNKRNCEKNGDKEEIDIG